MFKRSQDPYLQKDPAFRHGQVCGLCGSQSLLNSGALGVCGPCIRMDPNRALRIARAVHMTTRHRFGLPALPPRVEGGVRCVLCSQECQMGEAGRGYCGLRTVRDGRLVHLAGTPQRGILQWYRDPLPTNCVADWVCGARDRPGYHNLAVFYASCTLNCLFCQNWHFREVSPVTAGGISAGQLAEAANSSTYCVCFFGGDPASQMPHALAAAEQLAKKGVVICWETAGTSYPKLLDRAVHLSLQTGGCIKFDLKAWDETLHIVLTGESNRRTLENFAQAVRRFKERSDPPRVVASTLLVPGYVDAEEVEHIARFIANLSPDVPYALLAFAPHFYMSDLPPTSARHAREAEAAARAAGLTNVRIGNRRLLSDDY